MTPFLRRYLQSRAVAEPWSVDGSKGRSFAGAIVIPALAEEESLFETLSALASQPPAMRERFLTLVVVNNRPDALPEDKRSNRRTLLRLREENVSSELPLAWVDASSPGRELPRGEGVGLARRIGCDLVLERLDWSGAPLLVFLDADTLVDENYLSAIVSHFGRSSAGGAVLPFAHQPAEIAPEQKAAVRYELFLRAYVLGLSLASSPYAFHTIGSTIACRADAYIRAGGMNRRLAGEDFYFLQQLAKTAGVAPLEGTVVRPSARLSRRTPFGTGPSIAMQVAGEKEVLFYHPECFRILGKWLAQATQTDPMDAASAISPDLVAFLKAEGMPEAWARLRRNFRGERLVTAFHVWFDALKTLRLIHHLSAGPYPRGSLEDMLPTLMERAGVGASWGDPEELLEILRRLQGVGTPVDIEAKRMFASKVRLV